MLEIKNLKVKAHNKEIIKGLDLKIEPGKVHVLMGPNGSGKSSLAMTVSGNSNYQITNGKILFKKQNINNMSVDERARLGIFTAFQNPVEIPGLSFFSFIKNSINSVLKSKGEKPLSPKTFYELADVYLGLLNLDKSILNRSVNYNFSGGEKKKLEIFQMLFLDPDFVVLDEIDSGLDVDALKQVSHAVNYFLGEGKNKSVFIITHYPRILEFIKPDFVHIYIDGKIVKTGSKILADNLEKHGYETYLKGED